MALFRMKPQYRKKAKVLSYYGTATPITTAVRELSGTTVGNYVLFAGGTYDGSYGIATVNGYNNDLTKVNAINDLYKTAFNLLATTVKELAFFYNGQNSSNLVQGATAYNTSLTKTNLASSRTGSKDSSAATSVGDYALFDTYPGYNKSSNYFEAYDSSGTRYIYSIATTPLLFSPAATTINDYALFAGGDTYKGRKVYGYDASLTQKTNISDLSDYKRYMVAVSNNDYALFAGGSKASSTSNTIELYNSSLTKISSTITLTEPNAAMDERLSAVVIDDYIIFYNNYDVAGSNSLFEMYNKSFTKSNYYINKLPKYQASIASINNYIIVCGGLYYSTGVTDTVDIFQVA